MKSRPVVLERKEESELLGTCCIPVETRFDYVVYDNLGNLPVSTSDPIQDCMKCKNAPR